MSFCGNCYAALGKVNFRHSHFHCLLNLDLIIFLFVNTYLGNVHLYKDSRVKSRTGHGWGRETGADQDMTLGQNRTRVPDVIIQCLRLLSHKQSELLDRQ